jgi:hypothetical protein
MTVRRGLLTVIFVLAVAGLGAQPAKPLEIYSIDVEGGQATLLVSPSGESLLVDAGFPGMGRSTRQRSRFRPSRHPTINRAARSTI